MKMTDDAPVPTSSTATQKPKLVWSTPRVVTLDGEVDGKPTPQPYEETHPLAPRTTKGPS